MAVTVHRSVADDLRQIAARDPAAADGLRAELARLATDARGGERVGRPGWRVYLSVPGYAVVADAVGTGAVRVLGVAPLPTLYDPERLRSMAKTAENRPGRRPRRDKTVPSPAPRTRIVALAPPDAWPQREETRPSRLR
jgi:hypothetical protein